MTKSQEPLLAIRDVQLQNMEGTECEKKIETALSAHEGILEVSAKDRFGWVEVRYDYSIIGYERVEQLLSDLGYPPVSGIFPSLKRFWRAFTEENHLSNLNHKPHCCNKSPR